MSREFEQPDRIEQEFEHYAEWRARLQSAIKTYREWLYKHELSDARTDQRLDDIIATLKDNRLYIAFVAEYSRGKSELINAVFFAKFGQRVLPSAAGRTTMCPTELLYDQENPPYVRLLPIETRKTSTTISEYKGFPDEWEAIPLDTSDPENVAEALRKIADVKIVPPEDAQKMGLHIAADEAHEDGMHITEDGRVEIPAWRHAVINMPHPLLQEGLVILDTPGLNALGAEPELTLNLLASAHAVVFILAADTGVTKSDMAVWRDHIRRAESKSHKGALVVLNKIDSLWDGIRDWDEVESEINQQKTSVAKTLDVSESMIYPISAQKALLGKIRNDEELLAQSRALALEDALANVIIPQKRDIVRANVEGDLEEVTNSMRALLDHRVKGIEDHVAELDMLNTTNAEVIDDIMAKVKADKAHLEKSLQRFQATRSIFSQQTNLLYTHLNPKNINSLVAETKKDMSTSLTTGGLKTHMQKFFARAQASMDEVTGQSREIKELMEGVYSKFTQDHGLAGVKPGNFSTAKYLRELKSIQAKHEQYLSGMSLVMTEQMGVIRKFFESAVVATRNVYKRANRDVDSWLKTIMSPMETQVREHQVQLRRRLESIKRIHHATDSLDSRIEELQHVRDGFAEQEARMTELVGSMTAALNDEPMMDLSQIEIIDESA